LIQIRTNVLRRQIIVLAIVIETLHTCAADTEIYVGNTYKNTHILRSGFNNFKPKYK
jgi:hypothetical protein